MKDIIQIQPFKFSIVQLIFLCFLAGVTWAGYLNLSASVSTLTKTMKTVNDTMIVIQTEKLHRDNEMVDLKLDADKIREKESKMELKRENHSIRLETIENVVFK